MVWQETIALTLVAVTAGVFAWNLVRPRGARRGVGSACGCGGPGGACCGRGLAGRERLGNGCEGASNQAN
ncbi:MAG: hypothetical protein JXQ71_06645 [Verrucomicrobia bacterium]|nr:hypothetical protein [Verrucomicrobiota bacterium]